MTAAQPSHSTVMAWAISLYLAQRDPPFPALPGPAEPPYTYARRHK